MRAALLSPRRRKSLTKTAAELETLRAEKFAEIERHFADRSSDPSQAALLSIEMWEDAAKRAGDTVQPGTPFEALLKDYCAIVREIIALLDKVIESAKEDAG
jgi:hypothetical protein